MELSGKSETVAEIIGDLCLVLLAMRAAMFLRNAAKRL